MKKLLNSIILFAIALILSAVLLPLGIIVTLVLAVARLDINKLLVYLTKILYVSAEAIDLVANVVCRDLFNRTLRDQEGYRFGRWRETISSALGKNERDDTLTMTGMLLVQLLDKIDTGHCHRSIKEF